MTHIPLRSDPRGVSLFDYRPETARPLGELAEALLRGPSNLARAERELIAAYVSTLNESEFGARSHGPTDLPRRAPTEYSSAPISDKLKTLLSVAAAVQAGGRTVSPDIVAEARGAGASDGEIHDTVLIAAAFCMYNRYVDGLATVPGADSDEHEQGGASDHLAGTRPTTTALRVRHRPATRVSRPTTVQARECAVRRVIAAMRERYAESLSLEQLSTIAISSPFHFNRVFREVTGLPPLRFLSAVRLQVAKNLLLTTRRSVTNICFAVGYSSLGTFTTHFAEYVGAPPTRFRRLSRTTRPADLLPTAPVAPTVASLGAGTVRGSIRAFPGDAAGGFAIVALFTTRLPRGHPRACTVAAIGTNFVLDNVPPGSYHLFSAAINTSANSLELFLGEAMRVGHVGPITVRDGRDPPPVDLELRWPRETDPPLLVALPVLMADRASTPHAFA